MNDEWTSNEAMEFLSIVRGEAEKVYKEQSAQQSAVRACLAVVTVVSELGVITVRLLNSPSDGSQDFIVRNRSGSTLEVGDSVWLHYWSDYTNVYIAVRNMGDNEADITATGIGALSYLEAQSLTAGQKTQVLSNAGAAAASHVSQHGIGGSDSLNAMPYNVVSSNLLINGGFLYWQRGVSFASPNSGAYIADRWRIDYTGTGATRIISQQAFTVGQTDVPDNPTYFLRYNQSVAGSGGTFNLIRQCIENVALLSGQTVTLSFYAKAASATTVVTFGAQRFGTGGSADVGIPDSVAYTIGTTWAKYTTVFTVPSISGKTVGANNFTDFGFSFPLNSTFTIDVANVQLNYGSVALPFVQRFAADEWRLCQRYYQILTQFASTSIPATDRMLTRNALFSTPMRVAPTVIINSQPNLGGVDAYVDRYGVENVSVSGATISVTATGMTEIVKTGAFVVGAFYYGSAKLDAEL